MVYFIKSLHKMLLLENFPQTILKMSSLSSSNQAGSPSKKTDDPPRSGSRPGSRTDRSRTWTGTLIYGTEIDGVTVQASCRPLLVTVTFNNLIYRL